jgi:hypothetical protein
VQIAPVYYRFAPVHFDHLTVVRVEPLRYEQDVVHVTPRFVAKVRSAGRRSTRQLDARESEDLLHGLARVLQEVPRPRAVAPAVANGEDVSYDVEIGWRGRVYRIHNAHPGTDDALHAVVSTAERLLLEHQPGEMLVRREPAVMRIAGAAS